MNVRSAFYAIEEGYAASYSAYHPHFHDMPNFIREYYRIQDHMPKNVPHIPKYRELCRMEFGIIT